MLIDKSVKILMTLALSIISIVLYLLTKNKVRKYVMIAMLLSTFGDFFMTDAFSIGDFSTYPGALGFVLAHILYGILFVKICKKRNYKYINKGFYTGLGIMLVFIIVLTILAFVIPEEPEPIMYVLVLLYSIIIGFNVVGNFSYAYNEKGNRLVLPFAIIIFYITDVWIFLDILNITAFMHDYVWYAYPFAQLLLIIFCDSFNFEKKQLKTNQEDANNVV